MVEGNDYPSKPRKDASWDLLLFANEAGMAHFASDYQIFVRNWVDQVEGSDTEGKNEVWLRGDWIGESATAPPLFASSAMQYVSAIPGTAGKVCTMEDVPVPCTIPSSGAVWVSSGDGGKPEGGGQG
eukprot:gene16231-17159_t